MKVLSVFGTRPEAIRMPPLVSSLGGTNLENMVREITLLRDGPAVHRAMALSRDPYGDGKPSEGIAWILAQKV